MADCEWNPSEHRPAFEGDPIHGEAVWSVGVDGKWHLCERCAALPEFSRYRNRRRLTRRRPPRVKRRANRQAQWGRINDMNPYEPVPVPRGDGRHDIGDDTRTAIFHRLHDDFTLAAPWLTAEQRKHLAMLAAASVRALLHEIGTLRDLAGETPKKCEEFCPPEWTGHWRDWHRGHGCHLDPGETPEEQP